MFSYELDIKNWRELWFYVSKPKTCPNCRRKLDRVDVLPEFSSEWESEQHAMGIDLDLVHKTKDGVRYRCDPCHAYYSLTDLAARA